MQQYRFKEAGAPPEPEAATLERWAHRDVWTGVVFNGEKVGLRAANCAPPPARRAAGRSNRRR